MTATLTTPTTSDEPPKPRPRGGWSVRSFSAALLPASSSPVHPDRRPQRCALRDRARHRAGRLSTRAARPRHRRTAHSRGADHDRAEHVDGGATLSARPAPAPATPRVMFTADGLGPSESRAVFIDPGTGEIRGDTTVYGTSGSLPLRTWLSTLHRNLTSAPGRLSAAGRLVARHRGRRGVGLWVIRIGVPRQEGLVPPRSEAHRVPPHLQLARVGWYLGRGRCAVPLGHRHHLVHLRRRQRLGPARRPGLGHRPSPPA